MSVNKLWSIPPMDFLSNISLEDREELLSLTHGNALRKDEFVFHAGSPGRNVYILTQGRVKIYELSPVGREVILWFCFPGEMFGLAEITRGTTRAVYAQASSPSEVLAISMADFKNFLRTHPTAAMLVIDLLSTRLRVLGDVLLNLTTDNVESRVLKLLTRLGSRHGQWVDDDNLCLNIHLTHQEMADMIGTSRQTVTSVLSLLRRKGLVRIENQRIHIHNLPRLQQLYATEFPDLAPAEHSDDADDMQDDAPARPRLSARWQR